LLWCEKRIFGEQIERVNPAVLHVNYVIYHRCHVEGHMTPQKRKTPSNGCLRCTFDWMADDGHSSKLKVPREKWEVPSAESVTESPALGRIIALTSNAISQQTEHREAAKQ